MVQLDSFFYLVYGGVFSILSMEKYSAYVEHVDDEVDTKWIDELGIKDKF